MVRERNVAPFFRCCASISKNLLFPFLSFLVFFFFLFFPFCRKEYLSFAVNLLAEMSRCKGRFFFLVYTVHFQSKEICGSNLCAKVSGYCFNNLNTAFKQFIFERNILPLSRYNFLFLARSKVFSFLSKEDNFSFRSSASDIPNLSSFRD